MIDRETSRTPRVQVDYALVNDDDRYVGAFQNAGNTLHASIGTETAESGDRRVTMVKLGREVIGATSPYQVDHAAEELHLLVAQKVDEATGITDFAQKNLAGIRTFNNFPDSE